MGAPHGHALHFHGHSPVHRLPAHVKIVVLVGYVLAVVATPRGVFWPYAAHLLALAGAVAGSRVPLPHLAKRLVIEVPFVVFALVLPFVATGPRTAVGPVEISQPGLEAAAALLAKGTLGVLASLLLAATTEPRDIVAGFEKLRLPQPLVQIMSFMLRYTEVVAADLGRMRVARESRGFRARSVRQWPALGATLGTLFIRSYERGERVHLAMLSRGYTGRLPTLRPLTATGSQWAAGVLLPIACGFVSAAAVLAG
ncbi:cobalt ECF transporter T component CbiQ [Intrasporangium calvum]|uniref:cobalt ECF transporter T component CbiQ n=1 Tax=Intrasporangium calvum TaxID=53358 RepID=UPI000DF637D4|nr:cobalt ECF transporter T component CbiQ [Intrasporangium calvum]AXG15108.1 cobalt ECF transporter T component CbiQ [Intrasporangium calvum]